MGGMIQNGMNMNTMNNGMNLNQFGNINGIQNHLVNNINQNVGTGQIPMNQQ
jgi:hypothetical protein